VNAGEEVKLSRAVALHSQGQPAQAALLYAEILQTHPEHADALHLLGVTETQLGRPQAGLRLIMQSLAVAPNQPVAVANQGNALLALGRPTEALASYDFSLRLSPDYPLAVYGRGNALSALGRQVDALASFDRALQLAPNFLEPLIGRGGSLLKLGRHAEALAVYGRALELSPDHARAHLGRGAALLGLKAYVDALASIDRALELMPASAEAFVERGHALSEQGKHDAAIDAYDRALRLNSNLATAWFGRGLALSMQGRFVEVAASLRRALDIDSAHPYARGAFRHAQLQICDWSGLADGVCEIVAAVERGEPVDFPFSFLAICDSPRLQLGCARQFAALQRAEQRPLWAAGERASLGRIRVAYISADFLEHPTSYLMAGLFERHDRQRFETIAISLREDEGSPTARRVQAAFDHYLVAGEQRDAEVARLIRDLEVDVAVDLMGYTGEHRTGIFGHRPAPVQVNYLGFPATMGTAHIDYIIADEFLIPEEHRAAYSEQIAYLPECFQANDDRRAMASETPTRAQLGLPETGFVWSSFHGSYKLNPDMFDIWARLVRAVPGSVLWLVGGGPAVEANLRRQALARGVAADRLVFARSLPYPQHLARLPLADLSLDILPFNGGATSSDALWAGVPVLTCSGKSFAARMSGSLLHALEMPELVTHSLEEYERVALQLARDPDRLGAVRAALARKRHSSPLFDTDRFRRHLEGAFIHMVERHRQGLPPQTFKVPRSSQGT